MTIEEAVARLSCYQTEEPLCWRVEEERIRYAKENEAAEPFKAGRCRQNGLFGPVCVAAAKRGGEPLP